MLVLGLVLLALGFASAETLTTLLEEAPPPRAPWLLLSGAVLTLAGGVPLVRSLEPRA
jgi:hypothetical protein